MHNLLTNLPRHGKQGIAILADALILAASLYVSISMRYGEFVSIDGPLAILLFGSYPLAFLVFLKFGLYRAIFRYISVQMGWAILKAVSLYSVILGTTLFLQDFVSIPRSVVLINAFVAFVGISGSRVFARWWFTTEGRLKLNPSSEAKNVLIYGAGKAGVQLASAMNHTLKVNIFGFIDDDTSLHGRHIRGLTVYGPDNLQSLVNDGHIDEVLLAIPSASKSRIREIVSRLDQLGMEIRTLPGLVELATGRVEVSDLRQVEIADILGREAVQPNNELLSKNITGKTVMVTGGGGSIGSELCRQIIALNPAKLVVFERSEFALYKIDQELNQIELTVRDKVHHVKIAPVLGSVTNEHLITSVMQEHVVQTVYHAAAYKHVPLVEANPAQGVYNNVFGTWRTVRAATASGVESFVLISTDKAVRPTNVMGTTKRFAEMVCQSMSEKTDMMITMVRFGNVLGSSGSVVPLFKNQIEQGGPVTVTHREVTRYFMTIPEASQLVIQAGAMGKGGDVFVLDMGESIKIVDLARRMIRLSGLDVKDDSNPTGEIEIAYSGLRPGEKLYEELLIEDGCLSTSHPLILRAQEAFIKEGELLAILDDLHFAVKQNNHREIIALLLKAVTEYQPDLHRTEEAIA